MGLRRNPGLRTGRGTALRLLDVKRLVTPASLWANLLSARPFEEQARRERGVKLSNYCTCATVFLREKTGCGLAVAGRMLPPGNFPSLDNVGKVLAKDWRSYTQTQIWVVVERGPSVTQGVINEFKLE